MNCERSPETAGYSKLVSACLAPTTGAKRSLCMNEALLSWQLSDK